MKDKNIDWIKALGVVVSLGGVALSLLGSFVTEKKTDAKIEQKVRMALAEAREDN